MNASTVAIFVMVHLGVVSAEVVLLDFAVLLLAWQYMCQLPILLTCLCLETINTHATELWSLQGLDVLYVLVFSHDSEVLQE